MISLQPLEQYMILRKIGDHTDTADYYVRAVVRNSISGDIITTLNLTDAGDKRFYKLYEVPADVSGNGFYIDIETSVYSDSEYTTKASGYSDELEQYLVFNRIANSGGGGSGGSDVDYKKIAKILAELIKPLLERKETDLSPVLDEIKVVLDAIKRLDIPKFEKTDILPIISAISNTENNIVNAIDKKEVTPETNLSGLEEIKFILEKIVEDFNKQKKEETGKEKKEEEKQIELKHEEEEKKAEESILEIKKQKKEKRIKKLLNKIEPSERVKKLL